MMTCDKCRKRSGLCPVSFGLALGITYAIALFIVGMVILNNMAPVELNALKGHVTWLTVLSHSLWGLVEGFLFGFVLALIYDGIQKLCAKCCTRCCGSRSDVKCGCETPENKHLE